MLFLPLTFSPIENSDAMSNDKSSVEIPVIDISGSSETDIAKRLVDAAATFGFVYVKSEGKDIPIEAIDSMFQLVRLIKALRYSHAYTCIQSKNFFSSPVEEKQPCKISDDVSYV